jgi:hypothetical protein
MEKKEKGKEELLRERYIPISLPVIFHFSPFPFFLLTLKAVNANG